MFLDVIEQALQADSAGGMADQAHVQADRHHLRLRRTLAVEHVERVAHEGEPLVRRADGGAELAVVVGDGIGHDELGLALDGQPEGQLLAVIVAVVEEAAFLDDEAACVHAGPIAAVPAERAFAGHLPDGGDGLADVVALRRLVELIVLDPAPAVRADVEARFGDGGRGFGIALHRKAAAEDRHRQAAFLEEAHQPPEADPAAVFEQPLGGEVAAGDRLAHARGIAESDLGMALAVLDRRL